MPIDRKFWDEILLSEVANIHLEALQADGTLGSVFPEVQAMVGFGGLSEGHKDLWEHTKKVVIQCEPILAVRWAALFHDVGKPVAFKREGGKICFYHHEAVSARLFKEAALRTKFFDHDPRVGAEITFLIRNVGFVESYERNWSDSGVRRLGKDLGIHLDATLALARGDLTTGNQAKRKHCLDLVDELETRIKTLAKQDAIPQALPKGLGDALMAKKNLKPGPELGRIMAALKSRVEAGELPRNAAIEIYLNAL